MRLINKEALEAQKTQPQPPWLLLLALYLLLAKGPWLVWKGAALLAPRLGWSFDLATPTMRTAYLASALAVEAAVSVVILFRYRGALFAGYRLGLRGIWRILWVGVLVSLPLALYYTGCFFKGMTLWSDMYAWFLKGQVTANDYACFVRNTYVAGWDGLGWGLDARGVLLASVVSFTFPVAEEWLFSGFVATKLARRMPVAAVIPVTGLMFLAVHVALILQFGKSFNLALTFLGGCCSVYARFLSGSWLAGLVTHLVLNFTVFLFKWALAYGFFRMMG
jgi:membrane protease YdiL (CAAX protease family)